MLNYVKNSNLKLRSNFYNPKKAVRRKLKKTWGWTLPSLVRVDAVYKYILSNLIVNKTHIGHKVNTGYYFYHFNLLSFERSNYFFFNLDYSYYLLKIGLNIVEEIGLHNCYLLFSGEMFAHPLKHIRKSEYLYFCNDQFRSSRYLSWRTFFHEYYGRNTKFSRTLYAFRKWFKMMDGPSFYFLNLLEKEGFIFYDNDNFKGIISKFELGPFVNHKKVFKDLYSLVKSKEDRNKRKSGPRIYRRYLKTFRFAYFPRAIIILNEDYSLFKQCLNLGTWTITLINSLLKYDQSHFFVGSNSYNFASRRFLSLIFLNSFLMGKLKRFIYIRHIHQVFLDRKLKRQVKSFFRKKLLDSSFKSDKTKFKILEGSNGDFSSYRSNFETTRVFKNLRRSKKKKKF